MISDFEAGQPSYTQQKNKRTLQFQHINIQKSNPQQYFIGLILIYCISLPNVNDKPMKTVFLQIFT